MRAESCALESAPEFPHKERPGLSGRSNHPERCKRRGGSYFAAGFSGVAVKSPVTPKGSTSTLPAILPESSSVAV